MGWFRKSLASDAEVVSLMRQMHLRLGAQEAEIEKLKTAHQSLRGFVYARTRKAVAASEERSNEADEPSAVPDAATSGGNSNLALPAGLSKAELRRKITESGRFVPGRPTRHD